MPYVHVETVLVEYLKVKFPGARLCTETPANLAEVLPCIRVERIGGREGVVSFDHNRVDVDVFGATRDLARTLAEEVRSALLYDAPGKTAANAVVADAKTLSSPHVGLWDNTDLRRFVATYEITIHNNPN